MTPQEAKEMPILWCDIKFLVHFMKFIFYSLSKSISCLS